jgi:hypothetical protein
MTADELDARLTAAETELATARSAVGAAVLDGGDEKAASRRVSEAEAEITGIHAARAEHDAREARAEVEAQRKRDALARYRFVAWHVEYVRRLAPVIALRAELEAAELRVLELGHAATSDVLQGRTGHWIDEEIEAGRAPSLCSDDLPGLPRNVNTPGAEAQVALGRLGIRSVLGHIGPMTTANCEAWERRLAPQVKALSKDTPDRTLPWTA